VTHRSVWIVTGVGAATLVATAATAFYTGSTIAGVVAVVALVAFTASGAMLAARECAASDARAAELMRHAQAIREGKAPPAIAPGSDLGTLHEAAEASATFIAEVNGYLTTYNSGTVPPPLRDGFTGEMQRAVETSKSFAAMIDMRNGDVKMLAAAGTAGKLDVRADTSKYTGYNGKLVDTISGVLDAVQTPIREATEVLERLAKRDLTARLTGTYPGDYARVKDGVNATAQVLEESLAQVSESAHQVAQAASQIAASSQAVATGASEQAAAIEQTSSSLEAMASMVKQSADNAQQASGLAKSARSMAGEGAEAMQHMSRTMEGVRASAEGTSQIIKDINEIAFQTNLLALNAAVEAARAGEAGRGFAVVAEEVRSLALRSKEAANKTEGLIRESVRQTGEADAKAKQVAGKLSEITGAVAKVTDIVAEIAATSREQSTGIDQVANAVNQMNKVTQQNAASSEQSSSAAAELSAQSEELAAIVSEFKLAQRDRAARPAVERAAPIAPAKRGNARPVASAAARATKKQANGEAAAVRPEDVIPFENDLDFKEF